MNRDATNRRGDKHITNCERCGKRTFETASKARARAKQIPGRHLNTYRCPHGYGWHLGHLPPGVLHGMVPKAVYQHKVDQRRDAASGGESS